MPHVITVIRYPDYGVMFFGAVGVGVVTTCWWDPKHRIDANHNGYPCWATYMNSRVDSVTGLKRPGIWFGKGVPYNSSAGKSDGVFIHEGKNAGWSDGCIVAKREDVLKIWEAIPQGGPNVLVKVVDIPPIS